MGLTSFFRIFLSLAAISHIPSVLTLAFLMLLVPGATLLGANSVLLYGFAFVPIYFGLKFSHYRGLLFPIGVLSTAALAFLPGELSVRALEAYATRATADDFVASSPVKPKSIQLTGDADARTAAAVCTELCQKLLFTAGIADVFVGEGSTARPAKRFRIEKRATCPEAPAKLDEAFAFRVRQGECLIGEDVAHADADVVIREARVWGRSNFTKANDCSARARVSLSVVIGDVKRIEIEERNASATTLVERRTGLNAYVIPSPFYVGAVTCRTAGGRVLATQLASEPRVVRTADAKEILNRRYGLILDPPLATGSIGGKSWWRQIFR